MATNEDIIDKLVCIDVKKIPLLKQDLTSLKTFLIKNKTFNNEDKRAEILIGVFLPIYKSIQYSEGLDDYRTIACDTLAVWLSRSTHLLSDSDSEGNYKETFRSFLDFERSTYLFHYVLDFWNESGAALGNSLKELFIKMIQFLTQVLRPEAKLELFKGWLLKSLEISHSMRVFYFMVENLFREVTPKDFILKQRPHFIKDCMDYIWSNALANNVGKVIFLILRHVYNPNDEYEWVKIWSDNTIIALNNPKLRKHVETYLLPNLFKVSKSATLTFLKIIICKKDISLLLSCLKIAQETAIINNPFEADESGNDESIISFETIELLLKSSDPSYRIGALSLLVSSSKVSKQISSPIYKYIFASLEMMLIETDLETKNSLFSYLKKFIARIRDSTYSLNRDAKKLTAKDYDKFKLEIETKLEAIEESKLFLENLLSYVEKNLRPGSSYQRKAFSFKVLIALIKSGLDSRVLEKYHDKHKLVSYQYSIDIYDKLLIRLTVDNISDDFEDIREYSTLVLSMSPISIESCIDIDLSYNRAMKMLADMKGKNVDCGARFFRFLFLYYQSQNESNKCINILNSLEEKLKLGIEESKKNIAIACYKYNIHGYFAGFKFILEIINFEIFSKEYIYYLFDRLIDFSFDSWGVVKEILQHESPEGNLPKSIEESYSPELESKYGRGTQIISSYSWRTLKESTNLLDTILKNKKISISDEAVLKIGPLLLEQLATIRHRGAFSSVYPTFVSCCFACQNRPEISDTPQKWLYHNLSLIQSRSKYITRRSAGIPFLITAILTTDKSLVGPTFNELLTVAKLPVDVKENIDNFNLPQVNAFNCIKVIFIDSSLSDTSVLFVDKALELALNSFGSPFWAIRNCAVMLFTALQNRLFSSKKVRNNYLPTYPARLFFNKFTSIKDIFLQNLNDAISSGLTEQSQIEKIFPILTIMSRLEPTPNYNGLEEFKPLVLIFLENATWKVREMAARSLPALINSKNALNEQILLLMENIKKDAGPNKNKIHGSLLAVKELILRSNEESFNNSLELKGDLLRQNKELRKAILSKVEIILKYIDSYAIKLAFLQIIKHIELDNEFHKKEILELYLWFDENHQIGKCLDGSKQLALKCLGEILLNLNENRNLADLINKCLFSSLYELQLCAIKFCATDLTTSLISNELKKQLVFSIWNLLEMPNVWKYVKSQALKLLKQLIINNDYREDSMDGFLMHTNKLIELCNDESNEDIELNCVEALGSYIAKLLLDELDSAKNIDSFNFWLLKLKSMIEDDLEFVVRLSALKSLIGFNEIYFNSGKDEQRKVLITGLIFEFLSDDDEDIRKLASYHLAKLVLKLQVCDIVSVDVENLMIDHFIKNAGKNALLFVEPKVFNFYDDTTLFTDLFVEDHLLFTVEKHNVYQNSITKLEELVKIIENTDLKYSKKNLGHLISVIDKNLDEIQLFLLDDNHPVDGCFGWLTDEYKFNFVYGTLLINSCLKKYGLYDRDITNLLKVLNNKDEYIHPLIIQVSKR